jgi:hypothetical protein
LQRIHAWDDARDAWESLSTAEASEQDAAFEIASWFERLDEAPDIAGPVWHAGSRVLLGANVSLTELFTRRDGGDPDLLVYRADTRSAAPAGGTLPPGTKTLFTADPNVVLAVDQSGFVWQHSLDELLQATPDSAPETDADPPREGEADSSEAGNAIGDAFSGLGNMLGRLGPRGGGFSNISSYEPLNLTRSDSASLNPQTGEIAIWSRGQIVVLRRGNDGRFVGDRQAVVGNQENPRMNGLVAFRGEHLFVVTGNGEFFHLDGASLEELWSDLPDRRVPVRALVAPPDGNVAALVYRDGRMWLYDAKSQSAASRSGFGPQGDILAATFEDDGTLWIGDRFQGAYQYQTADGALLKSQVPASGVLTHVYRWIIRPLYRAFPKPGEFDKVIARLASSGDTGHNPAIDLTVGLPPDDPWIPLTSGLGFMAVMLGISCLVFQRTDF